MIIMATLVAALLLVLGWLLARSIVQPLQQIPNAISELAKGNHAKIEGDQRGDEIGDLARAMKEVYEKGVEAARLRSALDGCCTMVIVADRTGRLVYANPVSLAYFGNLETDALHQTPGSNRSALIGSQLVGSTLTLAELCRNSTYRHRRRPWKFRSATVDCKSMPGLCSTAPGSRLVQLSNAPMLRAIAPSNRSSPGSSMRLNTGILISKSLSTACMGSMRNWVLA